MRTSSSMLLGALFVLCSAGPSLAAPKEEKCSDLLMSLQRKPAFFQFLNCKQRTDLQGSPFEAKYRIEGRRAAEAEAYLMKEFQIKKLSRTCCVWESADNAYRDPRKRPFVISMSTEETTIDDRSRWSKIGYFYVTVDLYRDDP